MLLTEFTVAVQVLLLVAAMPAVARDLGGTQLYGTVLGASAVGLLFAAPLAGRAADRFDPIVVLVFSAGLTVTGMAVSAAAPSMLVVAAGRLLVGAGAAVQYVLSLAGLTRDLPAPVRARVFAIMSFGWILPGLIGPPAGGAIAEAIGWRWVMIAPIPLVVLSQAFLLPALRRIGRPTAPRAPAPLVWSFLLGTGTAMLLIGLAVSGWPGGILLAAGGILTFAAGRRVLATGRLSARAGLPPVLVVIFLANAAYFAGDGFVPLALSHVLGFNLVAAGAALTFSSVGWSLGSWWQSRQATVAGTRVILGGGVIVVGAVGVAGALLGAPGVVPYIGWGIAGLGMGITSQASWLAGTELALPGGEGSVVSSLLIAETVGLSVGAGAAGGMIAVSRLVGAPLRDGLLGAFTLVALVAVATAIVGTRIGVSRETAPHG